MPLETESGNGCPLQIASVEHSTAPSMPSFALVILKKYYIIFGNHVKPGTQRFWTGKNR